MNSAIPVCGRSKGTHDIILYIFKTKSEFIDNFVIYFFIFFNKTGKLPTSIDVMRGRGINYFLSNVKALMKNSFYM